MREAGLRSAFTLGKELVTTFLILASTFLAVFLSAFSAEWASLGVVLFTSALWRDAFSYFNAVNLALTIVLIALLNLDFLLTSFLSALEAAFSMEEVSFLSLASIFLIDSLKAYIAFFVSFWDLALLLTNFFKPFFSVAILVLRSWSFFMSPYDLTVWELVYFSSLILAWVMVDCSTWTEFLTLVALIYCYLVAWRV